MTPLGRRWSHVQAVAARAADVAVAVQADERGDLVTAAWLHDIGYSPEIAHTHFHPLDGARYLREKAWPPRVVCLVAHHSGARFEATERGLIDELLAEFPFKESPLHDALATADLTTSPTGEPVTYEDRINEILERYPSDNPVHRAWLLARPVLAASVRDTLRRVRSHQPR